MGKRGFTFKPAMKSRKMGKFHAINIAKNITHAPMIVFVSIPTQVVISCSHFLQFFLCLELFFFFVFGPFP